VPDARAPRPRIRGASSRRVISRRATVIVFPGIQRYRVCCCEAAARRGHPYRCNPGAEMRSARRFGARISGLAARDGRSRDVLTSRRYEPPQSLHSSASGAGGFVSETSAFGTSAKRAAKGLAPMQLQLVDSLELVELAAPMLDPDSCGRRERRTVGWRRRSVVVFWRFQLWLACGLLAGALETSPERCSILPPATRRHRPRSPLRVGRPRSADCRCTIIGCATFATSRLLGAGSRDPAGANERAAPTAHAH